MRERAFGWPSADRFRVAILDFDDEAVPMHDDPILDPSVPLSRRRFLAATTAAALSATQIASAADEEPKAVRGPEPGESAKPPVRVAVMGVNGRGRGLISNFLTFPEVEITHICDPDSGTIPEAAKLVTRAGRKEPVAVADFRTLLDGDKIDVLVCAAPDHWHALATVLACQAGKDVYVEKPVSHNLVEGRRMVEAARRHKCIVQVGTQRRSSPEMAAAVERVQSGKLGKVHFARAWITSVRPSIGHNEVSEPPANLDFNLWAGPAVDPKYKKNLVPYHWHWRWLYGTGECGNNGIHGLDVARWGLGVDMPEIITSGGGKYFFDDDQETPDTQVATFDFKEAAIQWEHRTWTKFGIEGDDFGIVFYGTKATLVIVGNGWKIYDGKKVLEENPGTSSTEWQIAHVKNFLDCRISRELPIADIEIGHKSTSLCHLANIAWRTRSTVRFDGATESIVDNPAAAALLGREYRKGFELPDIS
jgi:predicted dehydrogenase